MAALLALGAALLYGAADFSGALATRRAALLTVLLLSQSVGLAVAILGSLLDSGAALAAKDLLWGVAAGLAGAVGIALLYTALATTPVAVASPIAAVSGALLPVLFGIAAGERPGPLSWVGIAAALPAIALLTWSPRSPDGRAHGRRARDAARHRRGAGARAEGSPVRSAALLGIGAGAGFALFYIAISRTGAGAGLWPLVAARASTVTVVGAILVIRRRVAARAAGGFDRERAAAPGLAAWSAAGPALLAGLLDMGANIAFLLAARHGMLSIVTVVSSLYPAPTVLLARLFFRERLTGSRVAGLVLAVGAVACIGAG